jgi:hypothetical protein
VKEGIIPPCRILRLVLLVDKKLIKIDERTLYARPLSLVLRDAVGVVSGKHLVAQNKRWRVRRRGEPLLVVF